MLGYYLAINSPFQHFHYLVCLQGFQPFQFLPLERIPSISPFEIWRRGTTPALVFNRERSRAQNFVSLTFSWRFERNAGPGCIASGLRLIIYVSILYTCYEDEGGFHRDH